jgi:hypothetical protein
MISIATFVKRFPLITFFGLAYGFSWGSYAILSGFFLFPWGPWCAALIVASATRGRGGLKDLLRRCLHWQVGLRWYIVALTLPIAIALSAVALNLLLGAAVSTTTQIGPWYSFFFLFPMALFDAPLLEETGWRGYALPRFPAERLRLGNTLILAVLIAGWHVPIALSERTLFTNFGSDGMTLDNMGNVYLCGNGVTVFNAEGKRIEHIDVPAKWTANVCFGGKDKNKLFITASESVFIIDMKVRGVE